MRDRAAKEYRHCRRRLNCCCWKVATTSSCSASGAKFPVRSRGAARKPERPALAGAIRSYTISTALMNPWDLRVPLAAAPARTMLVEGPRLGKQAIQGRLCGLPLSRVPPAPQHLHERVAPRPQRLSPLPRQTALVARLARPRGSSAFPSGRLDVPGGSMRVKCPDCASSACLRCSRVVQSGALRPSHRENPAI